MMAKQLTIDGREVPHAQVVAEQRRLEKSKLAQAWRAVMGLRK